MNARQFISALAAALTLSAATKADRVVTTRKNSNQSRPRNNQPLRPTPRPIPWSHQSEPSDSADTRKPSEPTKRPYSSRTQPTPPSHQSPSQSNTSTYTSGKSTPAQSGKKHQSHHAKHAATTSDPGTPRKHTTTPTATSHTNLPHLTTSASPQTQY